MPKVVRQSVTKPRKVDAAKIELRVRKALAQPDSVLYRRVVRETRKAAIRNNIGLPVRKSRMGRNPLTGEPVIIKARGRGKRRWREIDHRMLSAFRKAVGGAVSASSGKDIFPGIWGRIGDTICEDWDFCEKVAAGEYAFIIVIGMVLHILRTHRGMYLDSDLVIPICALAWHRGPDFICDCPKENKEEKEKKKDNDDD